MKKDLSSSFRPYTPENVCLHFNRCIAISRSVTVHWFVVECSGFLHGVCTAQYVP